MVVRAIVVCISAWTVCYACMIFLQLKGQVQ